MFHSTGREGQSRGWASGEGTRNAKDGRKRRKDRRNQEHAESASRREADEEALRRLRLERLEMHYESLAAVVADDTRYARLVQGLEALLAQHW